MMITPPKKVLEEIAQKYENIVYGEFSGTIIDDRKQSRYRVANKIRAGKFNGWVIPDTFSLVLLSQIAEDYGLRVPNLMDVQKYFMTTPPKDREKTGPINTSLILKPISERPESPHHISERYISQDLYEQARKLNPGQTYPAIFSLSDLRLKRDENSVREGLYRDPDDIRGKPGLSFEIKKSPQVIESPDLFKDTGSFSLKDIDGTTGLPKKLNHSNLKGWYSVRPSPEFSEGEGLFIVLAANDGCCSDHGKSTNHISIWPDIDRRSNLVLIEREN